MTTTEAYAFVVIIRSMSRLITRCFGMIAANQLARVDGKRPQYSEDWFKDNENLLDSSGLSHATLLNLLDKP